MKLKYFLRGVGVGIIFGALIMLVAYMTSGASKLSDKEIIERAENLGMVKAEDMVVTGNKKDSSEGDTQQLDDTTQANNTTIENATENTTEITTESEIIQDTDVSLEGVVDESINATTEENVTTDNNDASTENSSTEAMTTEEKADSTYVTAKITVSSGMSSYDVALMLQNAGIIEDSSDFDNYLNENGYSTQIRINDYEFNSNMSYEELAKALIKEDKQ